MSGPAGHTGHTGLQGRRGLQGTPYGAPGTTFYSPSGRITVGTSTNGGNTHSPSTSAYGIYFLMGTGTQNVILPSTISSNDYGAFWTFRNNQSSNKSVNFTNTAGIVCNGNSAATTITIATGNSLTLVFSGGSNDTSTYIAI